MRHLRPALAAVAVVLAAVWIRVFTEARDELAVAQAAEAAGDRNASLTHYQYAMRWYTPFAAAPEAGASALRRLADEARTAGDAATELEALRLLRGGIRATRSLFSPFGVLAAEVDARLAELTTDAELATAPGDVRDRDREALLAEHARLLALDPTPAPVPALAATLGFLLWIGAAFGFLFRGLDADLRLVQPSARRWLAAFVSSLGIWMLGLWLA